MIKLKQADVVYNEFGHTYWRNGKQLQGITAMISRQLFPDKYKGIKKEVLDEAAKRGTYIHNCCELYDKNGFIAPEPFMPFYIKFRKDFTPVAREYVVTDNEHFASPIDLVWAKGDDIYLADIKSTSDLDTEYLSWQLSIYAYLFELQNPDLKVKGLIGMQIRHDKHKMVEIYRKPDIDVKMLMEAEINKEKYMPVAPPEDNTLPAQYKDACEQVLKYQQQEAEAKEKLKDLRAGLFDIMKEAGVKKWEGYGVRLTRTDDTVRETFQKDKFFQDHPELSPADYMKVSTIKGTVRITKI